MIVQVLLAQQAVLTDRQALIGSKNDHGVGRFSARVEGGEDAPDLRVQVRDDGVIFLEMDADDFRRARIRREDFIASVETVLDGERMLRPKIRRQLQLLWRIQIQKFPRRLSRIVRRIERDIHEERVRAPRHGGLQIINGRISDQRAAVNGLPVGRDPMSLPFRIIRRPRIPRRRPVISGTAIRRGWQEAARERPNRFEAALQRVVGNVPLARHECVVAGAPQCLTPQRRARREALPVRAA